MKNFIKIAFVAAFVSLTSCETGELELLTSPNSVTTDSADPNFILNDIQLSFNGISGGFNAGSRALVRMTNQFGNYNSNVTDGTASAEWSNTYQLSANVDLLQTLNDDAEEGQEIPFHLGMAKILEAYSFMLLVDYLGDVPYSEAVNPGEFPNPSLDPGRSVYDAQLELLDEAIDDLGRGTVGVTRAPKDLFYGGGGSFTPNNWIALANTLKLRAYLNLRLVDPATATQGINSLSSANIIDSVEEDFQFNYSTTQDPTESRHPFFTGNYQNTVAGYMSNYVFDLLNVGSADPTPFVETGIIDPRAPYYLYRQLGEDPTGSTLPCAGNASYDYCYVGNFYLGRDHTDEAGLPADTDLRTTWGIYPGGGAYDDGSAQETEDTNNAGGAGIQPIYLSSFTHFALAEASLTIGAGGNARSLLEQGIRLSMQKVSSFSVEANNAPAISATAINDYVNRVLVEYDSGNKLAIVAREYFLASWGQGIEPYNTYRRTGLPDLQSPILGSAGAFPRSFLYPEAEVSGNPNIQQNALTTPVFWDNNPANGFID